MTLDLPDPRCYAAAHANLLDKLASLLASTPDAPQRAEIHEELQQHLKQALVTGRDDLLTTALAEVSSPAAGRVLWLALDQAINTPNQPDIGLAAKLFAIPVVFVAGGLAGGVVPGILPDVRKLAQVLEAEGALGPVVNLGLNQALGADHSVEAFSPSRLYALLRRVEAESIEVWPDLIPAELRLDDEQERVEARFVTGIAVTGPQGPPFLSTPGDIAGWGMPFARELIRQLAQPGLSLLPIPRPPSGLLQALHRGHYSREEVAFQVVASRTLRDFRSSAGEPVVTVAALAPNAIEIRFTSGFDSARAKSHRWLLHPLDEIDEIASRIAGLLEEYRIDRVQVIEQVIG